MNEFKAIDLSNDKKTIFHSWKIKEGSTLSIGKVIFLYENSTETATSENKLGKSKTEQFKSNMSGVIVRQLSNFQKGEEITTETLLFTYEKCPHAIVINNMCGSCGEDLKGSNAAATPKYQLHHIRKAATIATDMSSTSSSEASRATTSSATAASVSIVHTDPSIRVSEKLAQEIGKEDLVNLVNNRKLVLLVDLDHTLIHTTNEHVNPNIKKIHHYELMPRNVWYHTKFRPGCEHFIETMSKIYELHMVTFGEKSYAHKIAQLMDPERRYFHDRILSRNEIINPVSKADNLKSLFPRGDLMVCIIDDREDVWNYARNLICVQPYTYFKHTGDINDPSLFKQQQQSPNATASTQQQQQPRANNGTRKRKLDEANNEETSGENSSSSNGGGDAATTTDTSDQQQAPQQQEQIEPVDPDDYLEHLERILRTIHDEYYRIYENRVLSHHNNNNNNNSHHHHHHNESRRRNRINDIDESDLPDVKKILPMIKSRVLEGCVITFSGVVPTGYDLKKQRCYLMAKSLGARVNEELVVSSDEPATNNDADVEAFEALLEASIPTIKSNPAATTTTTTNGGEETIPSSSSSSLTTTTTTTTTTTAPVINAFNRHKYEYRFEDEYDDSSSECSGGDYTNRSSDEDEGDESFDEDDVDEEKADIDETDELGEDSSSTTGSANNREQIVLKKIAHRIASAAAKKKKKNKRPTTHLVAAKYGTVKVYEAMKSKTPIKVVTPEWLINCNFKWLRCDENDYKLTKDYEYRNCIFHHDYNAH